MTIARRPRRCKGDVLLWAARLLLRRARWLRRFAAAGMDRYSQYVWLRDVDRAIETMEIVLRLRAEQPQPRQTSDKKATATGDSRDPYQGLMDHLAWGLQQLQGGQGVQTDGSAAR